MNLGVYLRERALEVARQEAIALIRDCSNLWTLAEAMKVLRPAADDVSPHRDSDGPRMAETPQAAWGEAGPARAEGIAQGAQGEQP